MNEIQKAVQKIQEELYDENPITKFFLRYSQEGYTEAVSLHIYLIDINIEIDLWNDQNNNRLFDEDKNEYEDWKPFLIRKIEEASKSLIELKSILNDEVK